MIRAFCRRVPAFFFGTLLLVTGCGRKPPAPPAPGTRVAVRFQTDWFPEPEHGGYYQALAQGYYAGEGLDVEILPGGPNSGSLTAVATGRADLGMGNGNDVITAIARGVPVRIVAAEMQHDAQGILFHEEHPIRTVHDLDGRIIMAGPASVWVQLIQQRYGIKFSLHPLAGDLARFMNDRTFLQQCFVTNEPYFARQRGARADAVLVSSLCPDYDPYRVIYAGRSFLAQHPEVVGHFVRASIRGWTDYLTGDPAPAHAMLGRLRPDLPAGFMASSIKAMRDHRLVLGDPARGERMGLLTRERLQRQIALLREMGVLDKSVTVDDVATLEFIPAP